MYIEDFKRYYFVNGVTALTGGRVTVNGKVDVLMTYAKDIRKNQAWIATNIDYNPYINNPDLKEIVQPIVFARKIDSLQFDNPHYILIANGRGQ